MKASTEEFLYVLLWTADTLIRPTWRNVNEGFEAWAWRSGLGRRVVDLERQQLIERAPIAARNAVVRLTAAGRRVALGGRDPEEQWNRSWDGWWRFVLFDIPETQTATRYRLWRHLRSHGFGFLQNSVWITPDPLERNRVVAAAKLIDVETMVLMQGRPAGGESDSAIVAGAWNFTAINNRYSDYMVVAKSRPKERSLAELRRWAAAERFMWNNACRMDPLLPRALLPKGYLGEQAWKERRCVLGFLRRATDDAALLTNSVSG